MNEAEKIKVNSICLAISSLMYYEGVNPIDNLVVAFTLKEFGIDRQKAIEVGCCERILKDLKKAFDILEKMKVEERE